MKPMDLTTAREEAKFFGERYVDRAIPTRHLVDGKFVVEDQMFRVFASGWARRLRDFE